MSSPTGNEALGRRLRSLRSDRGLKLRAVAATAGISLQYLSEVERGLKLPSLDVLDRLARALDASVIDVLRGVPPYDADAD
jgi:XRE family transcriptional regulator, regulator of sulfur utilization